MGTFNTLAGETGETSENVPELDFQQVLEFASKLNDIIFKRQVAIRKAQFDGWAIIVGSWKKLEWTKGMKIKKKAPNEYFDEVKHKYNQWKNNQDLLKAILQDHFNRGLAYFLEQKNNSFTAMAKLMTRDDFITFSHSPTVLAESALGFQPAVEYVMVLFAQACHETGNFTSFKYKNDGNMFGMMASQSRKKIYVTKYEVKSGGEKGWWPEYKDQGQSFADRLNWDVYNRIQYITLDQYMRQVMGDNDNHLKYATDPDYCQKWWNWIKKVFDEAGMLRPIMTMPGIDQGSPAPDGKDNTNQSTAGGSLDGLGWKTWAPIAAIGAIVLYLLYSRD